MYGLTMKYNGPGCYRFLDTTENIIYVGSAKNINRRLNSHLRGKGSNLSKDAYSQVARAEIVKTESYGKALDLEQFLINKYKPKYNKKDKSKNINSKVVTNEEEYKNVEHWKLYYELKTLDKDKVKTNKKQDKILIIATYLIFIIGVLFYFFK